MGMTKMFSNSAEFDNMLEQPEELKVSKVLHKAFIEVNEEGTEAAAATGEFDVLLFHILHLVVGSQSLMIGFLPPPYYSL